MAKKSKKLTNLAAIESALKAGACLDARYEVTERPPALSYWVN